ncbi:acyl-CoA thioester hydrolase/BAAT C-terminal domain-containing protein [Halosimplex amylolyticum]|uniref:acyl-CoA thioester hydrolase/BAAT C-terminal domain-containing protein n=1 Tax=Halosimplex amylolyticum TaxID=3396616 RepID=UPI003F573A55
MTERFVSGERIRTETATGRLYRGLGSGPHPGVLVLHGGGGAGGYERRYAALLAEHGYTALCVEYFGAPGVADVLERVPLETFGDAARWLLDRPNVRDAPVGVVGFSRGGEAALLTGAHFDAIGAVVAYVPSCYAFPAPSWMDGVAEGRATWTLDGEPVPFLPIDEHVTDADGIDAPIGGEPPNAATLALERSTPEERERAAIPVEDIDGSVLLVSGGRDAVWPATEFSERVVDRLEATAHQWPVEHRSYPDAGHAIRVPYRFDGSDDRADEHWLGGTNEANAHAAADAWRRTLDALADGRGE